MSKALVLAAVVTTLTEVVIACESPILNAIIIGGMVLLMVALWTECSSGTSDTGADRSGLQGAHGATSGSGSTESSTPGDDQCCAPTGRPVPATAYPQGTR